MRSSVDQRHLVRVLSIVDVAVLGLARAGDQAAAQAFDLRLETGNSQPAVFDFDARSYSFDSSTHLLLPGREEVFVSARPAIQPARWNLSKERA